MKKKIKELKDGAAFRLSLRTGTATYILQKLERKKAIFTSELSGITFTKSWNLITYPINNIF